LPDELPDLLLGCEDKVLDIVEGSAPCKMEKETGAAGAGIAEALATSDRERI
jgi:hypothetical protein